MIRRSTWIVMAVLVILIGLVIYLQQREPVPGDQSPEELSLQTTAEARPWDFAVDDVIGLRVLGSEGKIFYATRKGSEDWDLVQPDLSDQLDGVLLDSYLSQFLNLTPLSRLEAGIGKEALGLVTPRFIIRITLASGEEKLLEVGDETPTASGYYVRVDNTDLIVIPTYNLETILTLTENPPLIPTPTVELTGTLTEENEFVQATGTPEP